MMKKQILFLTFFVLAVFAGMNKSYGQEVDYLELPAGDVVPSYCVPAAPLTNCAEGSPLAPVPGVPYDYTITSSSVGTIHWFVTDDPNVMTAERTLTSTIDPGDGNGKYILTSDATYNAPANTSATINLTWKSFDGTANEVLLVAYAVDDAGCTDNIEVYRIIPAYNFTLDIAGLSDEGAAGATECVAPVQSATYDGTNLNVEYGINYVFFTVNAANWQTSWMPTFSATNVGGGSTLGTPEWAYPDESMNTGAWKASGVDQVEASHYASNDNGFIGAGGECIIIRVPVDHGITTENITDETINLVVNGEMLDPETIGYSGLYPDLEDGASLGDPCISDLTTDNADYVITPRPDITDVDPQSFENKVPRD
ncbi:hypothetical protein [Sunxiuqinia sp. sy24]|uniref:hypothetical protein n=1 Tax=Sunxiuqinia sp. sy24 TaxID=3461495 RepID=UPI004045CB73